MFDGPMPFEKGPFERPPARQQQKYGSRLAALLICLVIALACIAWTYAAPVTPVAVFSAPSNLRQIDVFAGLPGADDITSFYLYGAGFHARHKRHLLATVSGATGWSVDWQSSDHAFIRLDEGAASIVPYDPTGLKIAYISNVSPGPLPAQLP